jgi:nucleoside-diphosphate-sugar epimerase
MRANLRVPQSVATAIEGSQAVINAAGIAFEHGRQRYKAVHVAGARTIAEAARAAGVERLVHVSGIGADSRSSRNRYIQSKVAAEDAIVAGLPALRRRGRRGTDNHSLTAGLRMSW